MKDLFAAVCLVAVLEGLFLFVAPFAWKRMAERLLDLPSRPCAASADWCCWPA